MAMKRSNGSQPPSRSIARRIKAVSGADTLAGSLGDIPRILGTMTSRPVVLVTGAARRLGREIALGLAAGGFDIAVHYRRSADEARETIDAIRAAGAQAAGFAADLADETACRALVPSVVAQLGRLDAVVNNASLFEYDAPT